MDENKNNDVANAAMLTAVAVVEAAHAIRDHYLNQEKRAVEAHENLMDFRKRELPALLRKYEQEGTAHDAARAAQEVSGAAESQAAQTVYRIALEHALGHSNHECERLRELLRGALHDWHADLNAVGVGSKAYDESPARKEFDALAKMEEPADDDNPAMMDDGTDLRDFGDR